MNTLFSRSGILVTGSVDMADPLFRSRMPGLKPRGKYPKPTPLLQSAVQRLAKRQERKLLREAAAVPPLAAQVLPALKTDPAAVMAGPSRRTPKTPPTVDLPVAIRTLVDTKIRENMVNDPVTVDDLLAQAQEDLAKLQADPVKVHIVQRLLNFVGRGVMSVPRFMTTAGLAIINAFLGLFTWRLVGVVALAMLFGVATAVGTTMWYVTNSVLYALVSFLLSPFAFRLFRWTAALSNIAQSSFEKARQADLYYRALSTKDTPLNRVGVNLRDAWFRFWNHGMPLLAWEGFRTQYAYLNLSPSDLRALFALKQRESADRFQDYVRLLDRRRMAHVAAGSVVDPLITASIAGAQSRAFAAVVKQLPAVSMGFAPTTAVAVSRPPKGGRAKAHRIRNPPPRGSRGAPQDQTARIVLSLLTTGSVA